MDKYNYANGATYAILKQDCREYFYEDGTLKTIENYAEGKLHGETTLYWPNGKLKRKCNFFQGIRHGLDQMWGGEGNLLDEGRYEQGKPVGIHRRFNDQGRLIEEIEYLASPRFNIRQWDEHGQVRLEAKWDDLAYREKVWDRFQEIWIEKQGRWDGQKIVYL